MRKWDHAGQGVIKKERGGNPNPGKAGIKQGNVTSRPVEESRALAPAFPHHKEQGTGQTNNLAYAGEVWLNLHRSSRSLLAGLPLLLLSVL